MCKQEVSTMKQKDIIEELKGYGHHQKVITANRDGDLYFIECPNCHSTDLNSKRIICCRSCHTFFALYFEDGFKIFPTMCEFSSVSADSEKRITLLRLEPNDYFHIALPPRNYKRLEEIKKVYPDLKVIKLAQDLRGGKDAHGHQRYRRYALIPLD